MGSSSVCVLSPFFFLSAWLLLSLGTWHFVPLSSPCTCSYSSACSPLPTCPQISFAWLFPSFLLDSNVACALTAMSEAVPQSLQTLASLSASSPEDYDRNSPVSYQSPALDCKLPEANSQRTAPHSTSWKVPGTQTVLTKYRAWLTSWKGGWNMLSTQWGPSW